MTKIDIANAIFEKVGLPKKDCQEIVELVFGTIREALEKGENVKLSGFGNLVVRQKRARRGRNPQTGEDITISPRRVLVYKPSQVLKNDLNS